MTQTDIYLDYNATTPCDPRVLEAMLPFFTEIYGNPANGLHKQGRLAAKHVEAARGSVAHLIGAHSGEIIFTAGATESNNLAILGIARKAANTRRKRIVTSAVEHKSVLAVIEKLESEGFEVIILPVDDRGRVQLGSVEQAVNDETLLASIQGANNEVGTIQPIQEIVEIAHQHGALVHCDAAQAVGKMPVHLDTWGVDLASFSAHKLYGPKGIGALYIRGGPKSVPIEPILIGGGQERGLRPGTLNVPAIVGFGEACRICSLQVAEESERLASLRDYFERRLQDEASGIRINGDTTHRLPNTSSVTFPEVDADALLLNVPSLMLGTGSACTSGAIAPSHVLEAMRLSREDAFRTVRASIGRFTSAEQIESAVTAIAEAYKRMI
ncbi:MAG: cysteine desulfurase [Anaerolineales bacterium]|nr:cysteine desulfurase [Anaerolineales bacterium]